MLNDYQLREFDKQIDKKIEERKKLKGEIKLNKLDERITKLEKKFEELEKKIKKAYSGIAICKI